MEAKELRIGNYYNYEGKTAIVTIDTFAMLANVRGNSLNRNTPIQLTEEWLLKFGFEFKKTEKTHSYTLNNFRINFVKKGQYEGQIFIIFANVINLEGTFFEIHQLQNLYFALTGEELSCN